MPGTEAVMFSDRTTTDRAAASPDRRTAEPPRPPWDPPSAEGSPRAASGRSAVARPRPLRDRDESDPVRQAVELAQRGRMILDVSIADLEAAEAVHGAFHPITWHFRNACNEARRSWERLRAELGTKTLESALNQPPLAVLTLGGGDRAAGSGPAPPC